jgi:glycine/D-amino acid oxidase-like deaminating enzyme
MGLAQLEEQPRLQASQAPLRRSIYWRDTEQVAVGPPLSEDVVCDVCIVGGGYTGLWTAHFLNRSDPSLSIHVLEAGYAGCGASGHNDGFVTPTIGHSLHTVVKRFGPERAKAGYAAVGRSIMELRRFCSKNAIDAELEPNGFYLVATNDGQAARLELDVQLASEMGFAYEILDQREARAKIGSQCITGALKTPGALVNPHKLARGLARVVAAEGVHIHEQTRAVKYRVRNSEHVVTTPLARVVADRVVLANNAWQHEWAPFRRRVKPVWSYAMVSEPLTAEQLERVAWQDREGFVEACNFIVFGRLTAENRLLIGGGPAPYFYGRNMDDRKIASDVAVKTLRRALVRHFPEWSDLRFTHAYGGCIAVTRDLVPHVGQLSDGVFYSYGYCGNGIAMTHAASKSLRDLVLGRSSDYTEMFYVNGDNPKFPVEPIAFVGAKAITGILGLQDRFPKILRRAWV